MNGKKEANESCCSVENFEISRCKVESIISIDERGQMVLPKDVRNKAKIRAGDKLAVVTMEKGGNICCISLIKAEEIEEIVKDRLGPVLKEII
jgi:antitoxin PrlF